VRRLRGQSTLLLVAGVAALGYIAASPAYGGNGVGVTVNVVPGVVKSVNVTPGTANYINCVNGTSNGTQLGFPNGECQGNGSITITNGTAPATILVAGANMVPSDNGNQWSLCTSGVNCSQQVLPGPDEYYETTSTQAGYNVTNGGANKGPGIFDALTNTPTCDTVFNGASGCSVGAGKTSTEFLAMTGPSSSSDPSSLFNTSVTYTAS
jgi:hypothetical protein